MALLDAIGAFQQRLFSFSILATRANTPTIRQATSDDIDQLVELEEHSFDSDRLTRRNFRYMVTRANASLLVADRDGSIIGYVLVLFHRGTSLGRIYSIAVSESARGLGLGKKLLQAAELIAVERGCAYIRLEVRPDNEAAIYLYEQNDFKLFEIVEDYYDDHEPARRYEKRIRNISSEDLHPTPYYQQSTDFTCGPAALMMAMSKLDLSVKLNQSEELQIWRESTTIFMMSGNGGCGPHGLALAAHRRGASVDVYINTEDPLFVKGVRSEKKKQIIALVQRDFETLIRKTDIRLSHKPISLAKIRTALAKGSVPIVLISTYRLNKDKAPHWVTVTGLDDDFVYVHDPEINDDSDKSAIDSNHVPIERRIFEKMSRYGSARIRAALVLSQR